MEETTQIYLLSFEAKDFHEPERVKKKNKLIQVSLLIITICLIIFSAFFYILFIEPYHGATFNTDPFVTFYKILFFCVGMFSIIIIHEFGHIIIFRRNNLNTSFPYLIPGPPPLGMLGAFVKIKDDPQTRNQKFDVALGGIIFGLLISIILVFIGLLLSEQIDTNTYIQIRADYSGNSISSETKKISENLNLYDLLFLGLRSLMFEIPSESYYSGFLLPDKILILHPLAYTGWIGLLLSGLNLLPIPFLDGGHALKAIFPSRYTRLIGALIGGIVFLILTGADSVGIMMIISFGCFGAVTDIDPDNRKINVPNPTIPLTRSRKIIAFIIFLIIILLIPISFDNLLYGIGF